jgi:hypothetical protein
MKRRYRYLLNFLSCGLLLFALYLNFVKKEPVDVSESPANSKSSVGSMKQTAKTSAISHAAHTFHLR